MPVQTQPERETVYQPRHETHNYNLLFVSVQTQPERKTVCPDMTNKAITYFLCLSITRKENCLSRQERQSYNLLFCVCPDITRKENCLSRQEKQSYNLLLVSVQTQPERKSVFPDMKPKSIAYYWLLLVSVQTQPERKTVFPDMKPKSITYYWLLVTIGVCPDTTRKQNYAQT